jgi:hypothetical protein
MDKKVGLLAVAGVALIALAGIGWYVGQSGKQEKFRAQVVPIVSKVSERLRAAAQLVAAEPAQGIETCAVLLTDLAGLGADLKSLYVEGEKQRALVAAGQSYLAATQAFVQGQQEFARARGRLNAARAKVKESLDAKVRTSKFSMDFWKESHDRLVVEAEKVRKETAQIRDKLVSTATATQQAADAAGATLGRDAVVAPTVLGDHRKALDAIALAKD